MSLKGQPVAKWPSQPDNYPCVAWSLRKHFSQLSLLAMWPSGRQCHPWTPAVPGVGRMRCGGSETWHTPSHHPSNIPEEVSSPPIPTWAAPSSRFHTGLFLVFFCFLSFKGLTVFSVGKDCFDMAGWYCLLFCHSASRMSNHSTKQDALRFHWAGCSTFH